MPKRRSQKRVQVTITLPTSLLEDIDKLVEETDLNRSDVVEALLDYCFDNPGVIDALFPYDEETDEETDEEDKEDY